jgi:DNA-binding transcriptional LysR family regulator
MDLGDLRTFVAVAEELHFGRAARRLNRSQPPVSRQIQELERTLQVTLLVRTNRTVALTAAGRILLERGRHLIEAAEAVETQVRAAGTGSAGQLTVGFVHSAGYGLVPLIVRAFRRLHPNVVLSLRELIVPEQLEALRQGRITVGLLRPPVEDDELESEVVLREPFVVAVPAEHPLAGRPNAKLADFRDEPFVLFPRYRAAAFHDSIYALCAKSGFVPVRAQETNTIHTAVGLVGAGVGVALVPASVRRIETRDVHFIPIEYREPCAEVAIAWRRGAAERALIDRCREIARAAAAG